MCPAPQVYLIYGTDPVRIAQEKSRVVGQVLPREYRDENLTEVEPPIGRQLSLRRILADLMSELATPSFFPDIPRVVVIEQLDELFSAKGRSGPEQPAEAKTSGRRKKAPVDEACQALCRFLERDLPQTNNVAIFTALEDPAKRRQVQPSSALFKTIQSVGRVIRFKQPAAVFQFLDAFTARDLRGALKALPEVLDQHEGAGSLFRLLTRQVRFLIQAKLLDRLARTQAEQEELASKYFPPERGLNLLLEPAYSLRRIRQQAGRWSLAELNTALHRLERLNKVVYPSVNDIYVPDLQTELELFIIEACTGQTAATRRRASNAMNHSAS